MARFGFEPKKWPLFLQEIDSPDFTGAGDISRQYGTSLSSESRCYDVSRPSKRFVLTEDAAIERFLLIRQTEFVLDEEMLFHGNGTTLDQIQSVPDVKRLAGCRNHNHLDLTRVGSLPDLKENLLDFSCEPQTIFNLYKSHPLGLFVRNDSVFADI